MWNLGATEAELPYWGVAPYFGFAQQEVEEVGRSASIPMLHGGGEMLLLRSSQDWDVRGKLLMPDALYRAT